MSIVTEEELEKLKQVGKAVAFALRKMQESLRSGVTTQELDEIGEKSLAEFGAQSAPQKCYKFPGCTCISINEEAAHGIPGKRKIRAGDVVNIDVSAELDGYYADTGATFPVEVKDPKILRLCETSKRVLEYALDQIKTNVPINILTKIYEKEARKEGFSIIRNLSGHGLGKSLHEEPHYVPDFSSNNDSRKFTEGLVVAIEPFVSTGHQWVDVAADGWTLMGPPGHFSAQFEHTIVVTKNGPIVVTQ